MSKPKWTPGPWHIDMAHPDEGYWELTWKNAPPRNFVGDPKRHVVLNPCSEADAHLIVAAPDLYKALETLASEFKDGISLATTRRMVDAALAKARGETKGDENG